MMKMMMTMLQGQAHTIIHIKARPLKLKIFQRDCSSLVLLLKDSMIKLIRLKFHQMWVQVHTQYRLH